MSDAKAHDCCGAAKVVGMPNVQKSRKGKVPATPPEPNRRPTGQPKTPGDQGHEQRFDQLLDDVVFGKPTKR